MSVLFFIVSLLFAATSGESSIEISKECIPTRSCPKNEAPGCRNPCPADTCITEYAKIRCIENQTCVEGCYCKKGFKRTTINGTCVPVNQCPPLECVNDPNAKRGCGNRCGKTCADFKDKNLICIEQPCKKDGCDCKDGFVYDKNVDKCVKPKSCTVNCNKPHERYIDCLAGQCTPKTCDDLGRSLPCPFIRGPCPGGCICEEGYLRDFKGNCIKQEKCPAKPCGMNQTWVSPCNAPCPNSRCPKDDKPTPPCEPLEPCYPGCQCKPNYRLNATQHCILAGDCPAFKCTKPNEKYIDCLDGQCNPKTCDELTNPAPCPKVKAPCPGGCICVDGYVRDSNGVCIKIENCHPLTKAGRVLVNMASFMFFICLVFTMASATSPIINETCEKPVETVPQSCPPNEVLKTRAACPPDTCDVNEIAYDCIANQTESPMCTCKDNYLRTNSTGVCVPVDKCLPLECADDPNAKKGCGNRCKKTCADYNDKNKNCTNSNNVCKLFGCDCKVGFVYDANIEKCVKPKQCTKQCTKPNERYVSCLLGECVPKTCDDVGRPIACPRIAGPCAGGCICQEGFVRNRNGDCVDSKTCPSCNGDPNAQSGCGNNCGRTCDGRNANKSSLACPDYCKFNGCDCKPGYLLNSETNKCVRERQCPKPPPKCGQNEEFYCGSSCPEPSCNKPNPPICVNKRCKLACFCKRGFIRNANNTCVPVNSCPRTCSGPHEIYIDCPIGQCNPKTCNNLVNPAPCPRVIPSQCPGGCICKKGYLRDSNGICIEQNKCPEQCSKPNERYVNCLLAECRPKTCDDLGKLIPCASIASPCAGGCTCQEGFVRDENGVCVDQMTCPSCDDDPNAQSGCGDHCGRTCASVNANKSDLICPQPPNCQFNGCDCKPGYLFSPVTKKCVLERDCPKPPVCEDPNAQWKDCKDPCPGTCQNTRPACLSEACTAGCQCNDGYVLSKPDGKCVQKETCAEYVECGANQTFVPCTFCPISTCPESDIKLACRPGPNCPGGCGCKPGYLYNSDRQCILASECPAVECTSPNEEWAPCRSQYDYERCEDRYNSPPIIGDDKACDPRCVCIKGHYRNVNGECVPENECPPIV